MTPRRKVTRETVAETLCLSSSLVWSHREHKSCREGAIISFIFPRRPGAYSQGVNEWLCALDLAFDLLLPNLEDRTSGGQMSLTLFELEFIYSNSILSQASQMATGVSRGTF